jgi:hypothetical protein
MGAAARITAFRYDLDTHEHTQANTYTNTHTQNTKIYTQSPSSSPLPHPLPPQSLQQQASWNLCPVPDSDVLFSRECYFGDDQTFETTSGATAWSLSFKAHRAAVLLKSQAMWTLAFCGTVKYSVSLIVRCPLIIGSRDFQPSLALPRL